MKEQGHELQRNLKPRHMNMIAIGGAIGTGLFVGLGASISTAGPGGAMLSYAIIGLAVYFIMMALGEMATHKPVPGSFEVYGGDYVDPAFGFMMGWNYWYSCVMTISVELVATAIIMHYWFPDTPAAVWSALALLLLVLLNLFSAKIYGESEFWFSGIKVVTIVVFLAIGLFMIVGIMKGHTGGLENWGIEQAPFVGGGFATFSILMLAGFSFIGVEATAVAAGECKDPEKTVPKAIRSVFWRIIIFYIGAIFVVGTLISYLDPNLLAAAEDNIAVSPFTLVFQRAGLAFAAGLMNAVILTSVLSCGNSVVYIGSRLLYSMAGEKRAPKIFGRTSKSGVPYIAVLAMAVIPCICFLADAKGSSVVYTWLYNATGLTGFITWFGICVSHIRFRKAHAAQQKSIGYLKFQAKFYPLGTWFSLIVCSVVIIGQGYWAFTDSGIDLQTLLVSYIGLPIAVALYFGYKAKNKTKIVPLKEMDLTPAQRD